MKTLLKVIGAMCFTVLSLVVSQLMLKKGMIVFNQMVIHPLTLKVIAKNIVLNKFVIIGIIVSGLSSLSWLYVLSKINLSIAYPFVSLAFPLVLVFSHYFFSDSIPVIRWVGIGVIVVGLILVAQEKFA